MKTKVVLITGAAKRIGAEITRTFHRAGFNIVLHYNQSHDDAMQLKSELDHHLAKSASL